MTFEEEFPSLKGKGYLYGKMQTPMVFGSTGDCFTIVEITANCLDKQRVREAIIKVLQGAYEDDGEWQDKRYLFSELEKELGLEEK